MPTVEILQEPHLTLGTSAQPSYSSTPFEQQYEEFKRLRESLKNRAKTEGLQRLRKLQSDREEAIQMVEGIEGEIVRLMTELLAGKAAGVGA